MAHSSLRAGQGIALEHSANGTRIHALPTPAIQQTAESYCGYLAAEFDDPEKTVVSITDHSLPEENRKNSDAGTWRKCVYGRRTSGKFWCG